MNLSLEFNPSPKGEKQIYEKVCVCGKSFRVKRCHFTDPNKKYCSNPCRHKNARSTIKAVIKQMKCAYCQKDFEMSLGQFNQKFVKRYCSTECSYKGKLMGEMKKCLNCDKEFYAHRSKEQKCCSKRCDAILHPRKGFVSNADNKGEKNGMFKHGKYSRKGKDSSYKKRKVRVKVIERDEDGCLFCRKPAPGLHLHRVIYGSQGGKYEVDNCVQLCAEHHELVHTSKVKWEPVLLKHLESKKLSDAS